jgi:hypothetical protein
MKKNTRHFNLWAGCIVFLAGALIAFNMYNKGPVDVAQSKAIEVDPVQLYNAYITDSVAAHKNYDGKIVILTGEVSGISENTQKQQVILIKTSATGGNINCTMDKAVPNVVAGRKLTVKGMCSGIGQGDADLGISGDVYLTRTIVIN